MQRYLTTCQKDRYLPFIIQRDGPNCFYCGISFSLNDKALRRTYDHLDNDPKYNDPQNLVLAHWSCNQTKKYNQEYIIKASAKLRENKLLVDSLRVCGSPPRNTTQASKEIDIYVTTVTQTVEYLDERLERQGLPALNLNDTAESIAYLCWKDTGHGSPETIKRHIKMFCSSAGPYKLEEGKKGEWIIVKKT